MREIITPKNRILINSESKIVTKFFSSRKDFDKELFIYKYQPDFAPKLLSYSEKKLFISIELIVGERIINLKNPDFKAIANLFCKLHKLTDKTICLVDTNPKNFLYSLAGNRYFIIDFSDCQYRNKEFDLIHFLLFWSSLWDFEKFYYNTQIFLGKYDKLNNIEKSDWKNEVTAVITFFDNRRLFYKKEEKKLNKDIEKNREMLLNFF